jgi:hypothetical protein
MEGSLQAMGQFPTRGKPSVAVQVLVGGKPLDYGTIFNLGTTKTWGKPSSIGKQYTLEPTTKNNLFGTKNQLGGHNLFVTEQLVGGKQPI